MQIQAPKRLVVATANVGKLREFRSLLAGLPYELSSLAELGLPSPAETGSSFLENAVLKARHAAASSGFAAVADDSGIEVDALGGAPGIHSARYAGADAGDGANNAKLLSALWGVPKEQRRARYRCALVLLEAADAAPLTAEAAWEGFILDAPRGAGAKQILAAGNSQGCAALVVVNRCNPPASRHRIQNRIHGVAERLALAKRDVVDITQRKHMSAVVAVEVFLAVFYIHVRRSIVGKPLRKCVGRLEE